VRVRVRVGLWQLSDKHSRFGITNPRPECNMVSLRVFLGPCSWVAALLPRESFNPRARLQKHTQCVPCSSVAAGGHVLDYPHTYPCKIHV
jgi:hypothetical protein